MTRGNDGSATDWRLFREVEVKAVWRATLFEEVGMLKILLGWLLIVSVSGAAAASQDDAGLADRSELYLHLKDAFKNPSDDGDLPRVLLIGDSISIGYTVPVRKELDGKASVHRIPGNGQHSSNGKARIRSWIGNKKWDVIHFTNPVGK